MHKRRSTSAFPLPLIFAVGLAAAGASPAAATDRTRYLAADTLDAGGDASPAARRMLDELEWTPQRFRVTVRSRPDRPRTGASLGTQADALVLFPSPRPRPDAGERVNTVALEWYRVPPDARSPEQAPAVLVLHGLRGGMEVAHAVAGRLAERGIQAFVMHMPGYGRRRLDEPIIGPAAPARFFDLCLQAASDARRARDAIAALPGVAPARISIQGTSLGGFIAVPAAALDGAFRRTFLVLAGGNLFSIFQEGAHDVRRLRAALERAGLSRARLRAECRRLEPTRIAPRLDARRTWLYSASGDRVVPPAHARALARAIGLDEQHHVWFPANHYTSVLYLPWITNRIAAKIERGDPSARAEAP